MVCVAGDLDGDALRVAAGICARRSGRIGTAADGVFEDALILLGGAGAGQDEPNHFAFLPGADGRVLLGTDRLPSGDGHIVLIAVRQSVRASNASLDGEFFATATEVGPWTYETQPATGDPVTIGDIETCGFTQRLEFNGRGRLTELSFAGACFERNEDNANGLFVFEDDASGDDAGGSGPITISKNGRFKIGSEVGAVTDNGMFLFAINLPQTSSKRSELALGIKLPPLIED